MTQKHILTIDDIAQELGVSKTTVSRAISGKGRISDTTRSMVMDYIQKHNYRPNSAAKSLAEKRTYNLALVLPKSFIQLDLPYIRQAMNAICEEAFLWEYNIIVCLSTDEYPESLLRTLDNRKVDGVILSRTVENDALVDMLMDRDIPFATLGSLAPHCKGKAAVEADHDQIGGCYAFSKSFLHKAEGNPVAVLGNDMRYIVNQSRLSGFERAVSELKLSQEKIHLCTDLNRASITARTIRSLLSKGLRWFLAMDDEVCAMALKVLDEEGMSIGKEVHIASLCDSDLLASHNAPVSALRFDFAELGQTACRELLCYLRDESYNANPLLGYRIISRGSI